MNRKIVVTGASSEIGLSIAEHIADHEDEIILHAFSNTSKCESVCQKLGKNCSVITADFTKNEKLEKFCSYLKNCDILINAAAATFTEPLPQLSQTDIDKMIQINIVALIKTCRAVIPSMISKRNGIIINISSVTASRGNRGQSVYAGTKGFVESFSRALAAEYGSRNIRINCIAPGPIEAGTLRKTLLYAEKEIKESIVSKRLGKPEDVAFAVKYLCSDEASFINGTVLKIDGGFLKGV